MSKKDYVSEIESLLNRKKKDPITVLNTILGFLNFSKVDIRIYNTLLKKPLSIKELEKQLNLSERTIRKYIKRLSKEGLIIRKVKQDKRLKYLYEAIPIKDTWKKVRKRIQYIIDNINKVVESKTMMF